MDATITAGTDSGAPNNRLRALRFGEMTNARAWMGGQQVASGARVALNSRPTPAAFSIDRICADDGATVRLVVEDDCGDWTTFVGGGRSAR